MATVLSAAGLWTSDKFVDLSSYRRHRHPIVPVSPGFIAPDIAKQLVFGPSALAASIARASTLRDAPVEMLLRWRDKFLAELEYLIADGQQFELSSAIGYLADLERTSFAGSVGAGITDLCMNAIGYVWRDNAASLANSLQPHADFIYGGGAAVGHGVVLAEAHGSFANNVSERRTTAQARRKYLRQVRPYVGQLSAHGKVIHGYSVAFGVKPGTVGSFLSISETFVPKSKGPKPRRRTPPSSPSPQSVSQIVPASLALPTYRSNFLLMNALRVVAWIDWLRFQGEPPGSGGQIFLRWEHQGRWFLFGVELDNVVKYPGNRGNTKINSVEIQLCAAAQFRGFFAIEETVGQRVLDSLSGMIRAGGFSAPQQVELLEVQPLGLFMGHERSADERYEGVQYTLFRDGLAFLTQAPSGPFGGVRQWDPKSGLAAN